MNGRIVLLLALAALGAGAGCGGSSRPQTTAMTPPASLATFRNAYLEFRYPQAWRTLQFPDSGELHFHPMVYLSTQSGHDPCRQSGLTVTCGWPVDRLQPSGVVVQWENKGFPGWSLATQSGTSLRVGGRPARETTRRPGDCGSIGADETVSVQIARPVADNWTDFVACLRGPNLAAHEQEVAAVLASTRFLQP
jgi:hypothetical protein